MATCVAELLLEVASPELALVDPVLAARARGGLAEPEDTLARIESRVRTQAIRPEPPAAPPARPRRPWGLVAGSALVASVLVVGLARMVSAGPAPSAPPHSAAPATRRAPVAVVQRQGVAQRVAAEVGSSRRFAWAPVPGASDYVVQFFRGPRLVYSRHVAGTSVTVPASWVFRGRQTSLAPGDYRWYVWPLHAGSPASVAAVQAKLVVPAS